MSSKNDTIPSWMCPGDYVDDFNKLVPETEEPVVPAVESIVEPKAAPDVMSIYYGITSNGNAPVLVESMNTSKIYDRHGQHGFVILSANRSDKSKSENIANTRQLISDIESAHFRYFPVYGGYRGTDGVEDDYEPSFVVFPYDFVENKFVDFAGLRQFAIDMCNKYNQDSVFIMEPGEAPNHIGKDGQKVNASSSKQLFINDLGQQFFTSFKDKEAVEREIDEKLMSQYKKYRIDHPYVPFEQYKKEHRNDVKSIGRRFTSDIRYECYMNPAPATLNEKMRRIGHGEIVLGMH